MQRTILSYSKRAFLPHEESRLLSQMLQIVGNGIQYVFYKKYFDSKADIVPLDNQDWFIYTVNGYYDLAIYNWNMIFGSYSEPTHYTKLIENQNVRERLCQIISDQEITKKKLIKHILEHTGLNNIEYKVIHNKIKDYRDRYLVHREHHPSKISEDCLFNPKLEEINKTFESLYMLLVKIMSSYPEVSNENHKYYVSYLLINSQNDLEEFLKLTLPNFKHPF